MTKRYIVTGDAQGFGPGEAFKPGDELVGKDVIADEMIPSLRARESNPQDITVNNVTQVISITAFHTSFTTTHASSVASLADGSYPGQRKLITCEALGTGGDTLALAHANIINASGTQATGVVFDAATEFLLVEWTGAKWKAVHTTATISTA